MLATLALMTIGCVLDSGPARECVRLGVHEILSTTMFFGSLALSVWIGTAASEGTRRSWVGWLLGIAVLVSLCAFLAWIDFVPSGRQIDY